MSCGLVKFKLLWFPGGRASSLVKVYILLSFPYLHRNPRPFQSLMAYALFQHMNRSCVGEIWSCPHNSKITFLLWKMLFAFEWVLPFYAGWPLQDKKDSYDIVKSESCSAKVWILLLFTLLFPSTSSQPPLPSVTSRWHCSQVIRLHTQPPISPASSGCQRKKCKCICFTLALRAFSAVVFRGQMQCVWHRERISITNMLTGQWPTVPSPLSTQRRFPF